jgi:hypothetical protein
MNECAPPPPTHRRVRTVRCIYVYDTTDGVCDDVNDVVVVVVVVVVGFGGVLFRGTTTRTKGCVPRGASSAK